MGPHGLETEIVFGHQMRACYQHRVSKLMLNLLNEEGMLFNEPVADVCYFVKSQMKTFSNFRLSKLINTGGFKC